MKKKSELPINNIERILNKYNVKIFLNYELK